MPLGKISGLSQKVDEICCIFGVIMQRIVVVVEFFEHCGWGRKVVPKRRQVICAHFVPVFECVCACAWDYVTTRLFFFSVVLQTSLTT